MSQYPACPCCSYELLHRVSAKGSTWFCSHCYQEMPGPDVSNRQLSGSLVSQVLRGAQK